VAEYISELELLSEVLGAALEIVDSMLVGRAELLSGALETEVDVV
jgi:hypothetical protein